MAPKTCDTCGEDFEEGDAVVLIHLGNVTAMYPDELDVAEKERIIYACHKEHLEATLGHPI